jgi:hypothetical protein
MNELCEGWQNTEEQLRRAAALLPLVGADGLTATGWSWYLDK